jgi:hypothetical protein
MASKYLNESKNLKLNALNLLQNSHQQSKYLSQKSRKYSQNRKLNVMRSFLLLSEVSEELDVFSSGTKCQRIYTEVRQTITSSTIATWYTKKAA